MTVTSLEAAADEAPAVLGETIVRKMRPAAWDIAHALANGDGDGQGAAGLLAGRSYRELQALVLLLGDLADMAAVEKVCGQPHRMHEAQQLHKQRRLERLEDYCWLREQGVSAELAGPRVGLTCAKSVEKYEAHWLAVKDSPQREDGEAA